MAGKGQDVEFSSVYNIMYLEILDKVGKEFLGFLEICFPNAPRAVDNEAHIHRLDTRCEMI